MNKQPFQQLLIFLLLFSASFSISRGAIITVDNNSNSGGQFTSLQTAVNSAQPNDTIHVIGSNTNYGSVTVPIPLTIIGAGYNPPNQFGLASTLSSVLLGGSGGVTASGTRLMGLNITSSVSGGSGANTVNNVIIERCDIWSISMLTTFCSNWVVQNNLLNYISISNNSNVIIRNNIIENTISTSNQPNVLITNNVFTSTTQTGSIFSNVSNAVISNNIFYFSRSPQGCSLSTFNNNITFNTSNNTLPYGNNSGTGNLVNVNPVFNNAPNGGYGPANDYRLQATSPGVNAGTDNTDIGIYGSINPFPIGGLAPFLTSAPPAVPQIIELDILNSNVAQGDSLQIHIRARKQN